MFIKPLQEGNTVEDRRVKKVWPKPGDTERYSGIFGEVTKVTDDAFYVRWPETKESKEYEMGYAWDFFGEDQIARVDGVLI